jgi:integrase
MALIRLQFILACASGIVTEKPHQASLAIWLMPVFRGLPYLKQKQLSESTAQSVAGRIRGACRVMVFVAVTTGLRVSELLGLRWLDCDFEDGEIHLTRGIVRQHETAMKTEASRKPVPMEMGLADVLKTWRMECGFSQPSGYIFASADMDGKQPLWPNSAMEDHILPAAIRAKIAKRLGWHTLRHTFVTLLKANGEDVAVVQSLMRHANVSVTMDKYVQTVTPAKRAAQRGIVGLKGRGLPGRGGAQRH